METQMLQANAKPIQIVAAGDGTTMLVNLDTANTINLSNELSISQGALFPMGPLATIVVDGQLDVYCQAASGSPTIAKVPGGVNFFQLLEILVKTLLIEATAGNGLFVYSGVPAIGDLIAEITAPGTSSDPFGNNIPSSGVLNVGLWDNTGTLKQHFGINSSGDIFLANSNGLVVIHGHSIDGSLWFYSTAGQGPGNLRESIAPAAGTDSSGNAYVAGIASYAGTLVGQLISATLSLSAAGDDTSAIVSGSGGSLTLNSGRHLSSQTISVLQALSSGSPTGTAQIVIAAGGVPTPSTTALLEVQGAIRTTALATIQASGNFVSDFGVLSINSVGKGIQIKEGSGAKQGVATLVGGTVTVTNSNVTAVSRIFLTAQDNSSTGALRISARTAGTSFTITSSNAADSGVVAWEIFEPA